MNIIRRVYIELLMLKYFCVHYIILNDLQKLIPPTILRAKKNKLKIEIFA